MKWTRLAVAALFAMASGSAWAFHDGGVAECDGCHVMHNASGGVAAHTVANQYNNQTNSYLLQGSDQSSTCLVCHGAPRSAFSPYHVANFTTTGPTGTATEINYTPGGDFGWLRFTTTYAPWPGANLTSRGERKGHNVVAADFGLVADSVTVAPGGTFSGGAGKAAFACSNCHDPHGRYRLAGTAADNYAIAGPSRVGAQIDPIVASGSYGQAPAAGQAVGVYRLLAGRGYAPMSNPSFPFSYDPPIAVSPASYNKAENTAANETRVAYGTGMSEWCANCHSNIHLDAYVTGAPGLKHPAGSTAHFRDAQAQIYNAYISSGNLTGTNVYTSLVPFESGNVNLTTLADNANGRATTLQVASTSSNVMCLSCHRAHAGGFESITRWNNLGTFLTDSTGVVFGDEMLGYPQITAKAAYYERDVGAGFGPFQRSMCNKCHAKD